MADPVNGTVLPVPGEVPASASARDAEAETAVAAAPSLLARTLGHASAEAEVKAKVHDATEGVHNDELPKAEHTPQQVKDIAAADNEVPAVAAGDSDRALDPDLDDLGWSEDPNVPVPLLHGLKNEALWQLIRRFNNQVTHVKALEEEPWSGIDLNIADEDPFSPQKLKATLERLYLGAGLGLVAAAQHIARLRSWHEKRRSTLFAVCYALAWGFNVVIPAFLALITLLLVSPRSRHILFPHAPLAAISLSGKAKVPASGELGSHSLTGGRETYKGEAAEAEASQVVGSLSKVLVASAVGSGGKTAEDSKHAEDEDSDDDNEKSTDVEQTAKIHAVTSDAATTKTGGSKEAAADTAAAVDASIWEKLQPILHVLEDIADTWERFGNALSPMAPFHRHRSRVFLGALLAPVVLISYFVTPVMVWRGMTAGTGFAFFAQPLFDRLKISDLRKFLDEKFPNWPALFELRHSILKGVPTDAQLTITMLRIGEANKSPLPPPPLPSNATPEAVALEGHEISAHPDMPAEYADSMRDAASEHAAAKGADDATDEKPKKRSKLMRLIKGTTATGTNAALAANAAQSTFSEHARRRLGIVKDEDQLGREASGDGPTSFHGRHHGKRGLLLISTSSTTPCVSFEKHQTAAARAAGRAAQSAADAAKHNGEDTKTSLKLQQQVLKSKPDVLFSIQIDEIKALRKLNGVNVVAKMIIGWSLDAQVADGIEITTTDGKIHVVSAMPRRDEVFNRLVSLGAQKWEIW